MARKGEDVRAHDGRKRPPCLESRVTGEDGRAGGAGRGRGGYSAERGERGYSDSPPVRSGAAGGGRGRTEHGRASGCLLRLGRCVGSRQPTAVGCLYAVRMATGTKPIGFLPSDETHAYKNYLNLLKKNSCSQWVLKVYLKLYMSDPQYLQVIHASEQLCVVSEYISIII